jgi:hypothetical protein
MPLKWPTARLVATSRTGRFPDGAAEPVPSRSRRPVGRREPKPPPAQLLMIAEDRLDPCADRDRPRGSRRLRLASWARSLGSWLSPTLASRVGPFRAGFGPGRNRGRPNPWPKRFRLDILNRRRRGRTAPRASALGKCRTKPDRRFFPIFQRLAAAWGARAVASGTRVPRGRLSARRGGRRSARR